jgi:hypothetical protein
VRCSAVYLIIVFLELVELLRCIRMTWKVFRWSMLVFPDIVDLTFSFKFFNFSFHICLLFVPEMSANITSYIVQIIYIALALEPVSNVF